MFLLLILTIVHAHDLLDMKKKELFIQSESFGLYLYKADCDYHIFAAEGVNKTTYSYPIENEFHLTYNGEFVLNNRKPNILNKTGVLSPPDLIKELLRPININSSIEPLQVCYDFSTERLSLKIVVGFLGVLVLVSNGTKIRTFVEKISPDLPQSSFTRWFSRPRGSLAGSEATHSPVKERASAWFSESPEALFQT